MIGDAADRYRQLLLELVAAREVAGGKLPQAEEVVRLGALDRVWRAMTEDEQDAYEASI